MLLLLLLMMVIILGNICVGDRVGLREWKIGLLLIGLLGNGL